MIVEFQELGVGAYFHIKTARYIKVTDKSAVVVKSDRLKFGHIQEFNPDYKIIKWYNRYD